jgi:hypothetical protein
VAPRGVYNDNFVLLLPEEGYALFGYFNWVGLVSVSKEGALDFG